MPSDRSLDALQRNGRVACAARVEPSFAPSAGRADRSPAALAVSSAVSTANPLVLLHSVTNRRSVIHACPQALAAGVRVGMSLVEATSLCEGLEHLEAEPEKDQRALEHLGRWLVRFSPIVSPQAPDAIAIDVTGIERLFGSQTRLLAIVHRALARLQIHMAIATAPTLGAACAMAYALDEGGRVIEPGEVAAAIDPLPIAALRIEEPVRQTLNHLGVQTIAQLRKLPRSTLPSRFGPGLLQRIDQAFGDLPEPLIALPHAEPIVAFLEFEGKVEAFETLEYAVSQLLSDVLLVLQGRGCGARMIHLDFVRDKLPAVRKTIALSQPSRLRRLLMNLLRCTLETVETDDGFIGLRMEVITSEKVAEPQLSLFEQREEAGRWELAQLVERLRQRLGEADVQSGTLVESHLPERAAGRAAVDLNSPKPVKVLPRRGVRTKTRSKRPPILDQYDEPREAAPALLSNVLAITGGPMIAVPAESDRPWRIVRKTDEKTCVSEAPFSPASEAGTAVIEPRPLRLFAEPIEVRCIVVPSTDEVGQPAAVTLDGVSHPITHAVGPERITGVWWEGRRKTRDYYDVELPSGRRLWLFQVQETRRWFWQGEF